jgi:hypothetical protein
MMKRIVVALLVGSICVAIIGAAGFAISEWVFGRGIGILGNSPPLAAFIGAIYLGVWGGLIGAIIGIVNLNVYKSGAIGLCCGVILVIREIWRNKRGYFYEGGYFDRQMFLSDIIHWITLVLGLAFVAVVVSVLQKKRLGVGK